MTPLTKYINKDYIDIVEYEDKNISISNTFMLGFRKTKGINIIDFNIIVVKFLKVCEKELDKNKYYVQTPEKEKKYYLSFAKIRDITFFTHITLLTRIVTQHCSTFFRI